MKPNQMPRASISPITRTVMVQSGTTCLMIKVQPGVSDHEAQDRIKYSDYMAQLAVKGKTGEYKTTFINTLNEFNLGFEILDMSVRFA